jgi:cell fate regulator YaaT (PSP1 superfamily)
LTEVISVKFKNRGKSYYFSPNGKIVKTGQQVIVETSKGLEIADCFRGNHEVEDDAVVQPLRPVIRVATRDDLRVAEINKQREKEAFEICQQKIAEHGLDMKLVDVECNFEGNKTMFFFTSDGRVDFRELVKDLAGIFRNRIELRQIGVRDEAKMLGGLGICGRPFCCSQFIDEFQPVSTKMAKVQSMSLNPGKISGSCGRLMCCLRYEQEAYEELTKNVPKQGAFVETPSGYGVVTQVNLLRQMVKVKLDGEGDDTVKTYRADEVAAVPGGRPKDGETPPSVLKYVPEPEVEEEEETDIWKLPELFADDGSDKDKESAPAQKKRSRNRRSRRGGGKKPAEQSVSAEQPKPQQQAKSPDGEKKRSNRRYYHRGKPKNKGGQAQNQ